MCSAEGPLYLYVRQQVYNENSIKKSVTRNMNTCRDGADKPTCHQLINPYAYRIHLFYMLAWQITIHDSELEFYTKAINQVFFQHILTLCQALITSPVILFSKST